MMTDRTEIECTKSNAPPVHAYSVQVILSFLSGISLLISHLNSISYLSSP